MVLQKEQKSSICCSCTTEADINSILSAYTIQPIYFKWHPKPEVLNEEIIEAISLIFLLQYYVDVVTVLCVFIYSCRSS